MENLKVKVKVKNETESKEAISLGEKLGFIRPAEYSAKIDRNGGFVCFGFSYNEEYEKLILIIKGFSHNDMDSIQDYNELTIPQLKDMVVLKRNDASDANVYQEGDVPCLYDLYLTSSNDLYFYHIGKKAWILSNLNGDKYYYKLLKPIEKKEMKEFLVNHDGKWTLQLLDADTEENSFRVAVPSGADLAVSHKNGNVYFWKDNGLTNWVKKELDFLGRDNGWYECNSSKLTTLDEFINEWVGDAEIIWQRSETEYLMQGENGDKLMESIAELKNQETVKVTIDGLKHRVGVEPNKTTVDAMKEADKLFADAVNNPSHYSDSTIECIDAMEAMLSPQEFIGYLRGNVFKYQWRYQKKNGIEDLQKSEWYLKNLIEKEMKNEDK